MKRREIALVIVVAMLLTWILWPVGPSPYARIVEALANAEGLERAEVVSRLQSQSFLVIDENDPRVVFARLNTGAGFSVVDVYFLRFHMDDQQRVSRVELTRGHIYP